jgi:hypothetical protein
MRHGTRVFRPSAYQFKSRASPRNAAAPMSQICQWEKMPVETKKLFAQWSSAATLQKEIVNATNAEGLSNAAIANARL